MALRTMFPELPFVSATVGLPASRAADRAFVPPWPIWAKVSGRLPARTSIPRLEPSAPAVTVMPPVWLPSPS